MAESNVKAFPAAEDEAQDVGGVAGKRLKSFIERVERLEEGLVVKPMWLLMTMWMVPPVR